MASKRNEDMKAERETLWERWHVLDDGPQDEEAGIEMDRIMERIMGIGAVLDFKWKTVLDPGPNYRGPDRTPSGQPVCVRGAEIRTVVFDEMRFFVEVGGIELELKGLRADDIPGLTEPAPKPHANWWKKYLKKRT